MWCVSPDVNLSQPDLGTCWRPRIAAALQAFLRRVLLEKEKHKLQRHRDSNFSLLSPETDFHEPRFRFHSARYNGPYRTGHSSSSSRGQSGLRTLPRYIWTLPPPAASFERTQRIQKTWNPTPVKLPGFTCWKWSNKINIDQWRMASSSKDWMWIVPSRVGWKATRSEQGQPTAFKRSSCSCSCQGGASEPASCRPWWSLTHWHHEPHPGLHSSRWISDWQPEIGSFPASQWYDPK